MLPPELATEFRQPQYRMINVTEMSSEALMLEPSPNVRIAIKANDAGKGAILARFHPADDPRSYMPTSVIGYMAACDVMGGSNPKQYMGWPHMNSTATFNSFDECKKKIQFFSKTFLTPPDNPTGSAGRIKEGYVMWSTLGFEGVLATGHVYPFYDPATGDHDLYTRYGFRIFFCDTNTGVEEKMLPLSYRALPVHIDTKDGLWGYKPDIRVIGSRLSTIQNSLVLARKPSYNKDTGIFVFQLTTGAQYIPGLCQIATVFAGRNTIKD